MNLAIFPPSPGILRRAALKHAQGKGLESFLARFRREIHHDAHHSAYVDPEAAALELAQAERGMVTSSLQGAEALADGRRGCPPCDARAVTIAALELLADDLAAGTASVHVDIVVGYEPWPMADLVVACVTEVKRLRQGGALAEW